MPNIKYTKDGKKVVVIGKLNATQYIVQEIFIVDGGEVPSGEQFIETTLLDKPAETWKQREENRLQERVNKLKADIENCEKRLSIVTRKETVVKWINYVTEKYEDIDLSQLHQLFMFMSGQISHVIAEDCGDYTILCLADAIADTDSWHHTISVDGLKLVTLFGCTENYTRGKDDRSFRLDWRINQYRDGSGFWRKIYPCASLDAAIVLLDSLIGEKPATEKLIELKAKYNLSHPSQEKIVEYYQKIVASKEARIQDKKNEIDKLKIEISSLTS